MFYLYISLIGIFDLIGMISAKMFSDNKTILFLVMAILSFAITGALLAYSLQYKEMAIANIIWIVVSIVLVTIVDIAYFKEAITSVQLLGIILAIIGIILANIKR